MTSAEGPAAKLRDAASEGSDERELSQTVADVLAFQAGDDAVLGALFQRYYARVLRIVRLRMGPNLRRAMESSDLVQETFAAAVEDLKAVRLAGEGALIHWLAAVAENVIRGKADYLQAKKRDQRLEVELQGLSSAVSSGEFRVELVEVAPSPLDHVCNRETLLALIACMSELTPEYREVLILRRVAGCSAEYAASRMQRSVGAIHMLTGRAEARLASLMADRNHRVEGL